MPNEVKAQFLSELSKRIGTLQKLGSSQSLYAVGGDQVRVYVRYSRLHGADRTFYGLRESDLRQLQGRKAFLCFLWDGQPEPLVLDFSDYEELFQNAAPATDGQYKVQVYVREDGTYLYLARAGRFNVEADIGWSTLETAAKPDASPTGGQLTHPQVQTMLGAIGSLKGYEVWVPTSDRTSLDWTVAEHFACSNALPERYSEVDAITKEIDVAWIKPGSGDFRALFEVEHSTSIYSGLLRLNDLHLVTKPPYPSYSVVANESRRSVFVKHVSRPTFRASGLCDVCAFLDYDNVLNWYRRLDGSTGSREDRT